MADLNVSRHVVSELTRGLTKNDVDALRRRAGLDELPAGSLVPALAEQGFTVEDLIVLLMATLVEKASETKEQAAAIEELSRLCEDQRRAIDHIADQTGLLKSALGELDGPMASERPIDLLKSLVAHPTQKPN